MPKGNHSKSNFLNIKALSDSESKQVLKSDLSNVVEVVSKGAEKFEVPSLENVDKNALQSTEYRRLKDRLFNTATIKHQQPGSMRIRTVREDGATISVLALKEAEVDVGITDSIRIRAVLQNNEYNLPHSEWVNYDFIGKEMATSVNQYRIQGWTEDFVKSQWVYSNIRNEHNEEILFRLIHDFLDVTLNVYDDQIDIVTDFMLGDKIIMLIKEHAPEMYNALDLNDELKYRLSEILEISGSFTPTTIEEEMVAHLLETFSVQSTEFHEVIQEYFYASIEELSVLMQSFKTQDRMNFVLYDSETLSEIMAKLEDIYEKIVNRSNIEVFLSNESNSSLSLESCFKLDIKAENIGHYFNIGFSDSVVSTIQSTVQLLVSSDVNDLADAVIYDKPYTEFLGYMQDVLPMYRLLEETEALMLMYAQDQFNLDLHENPIHYALFDSEGFFNYELAYEVFSFIGEDFLNLHIDADMHDLFGYVFNEKPLVMIDRLLEEFYKFSVEDEFELMDAKEKLDYISEVYKNRVLYDFDIAVKKVLTSSIEDYIIERVEDALIMSSILYYDHYDIEYLGHKFDSDRYKAGREIGLIEDDKPIRFLEVLTSISNDGLLTEESKTALMQEYVNRTNIQDFFNFEESKVIQKKEQVRRLVQFLIRENIPSALPEKMLYKYLINLADHYIIDGKEKIQYGLINKEGDYPIGKFIIGTHTLSGEENLSP